MRAFWMFCFWVIETRRIDTINLMTALLPVIQDTDTRKWMKHDVALFVGRRLVPIYRALEAIQLFCLRQGAKNNEQ